MDKKKKKSLINYIFDAFEDYRFVSFSFDADELSVFDKLSPMHKHFKYDSEDLLSDIAEFVEFIGNAEVNNED